MPATTEHLFLYEYDTIGGKHQYEMWMHWMAIRALLERSARTQRKKKARQL